MDDSMINSNLHSSSIHLQNVEQSIKNLEKQTVNIDNIEDILNNQIRQEIISKSFSINTDDHFLMEHDIHRNLPYRSTSWRQMKENQQINTEIQSNEIRSSSPLSLYKIFQQKSNTISTYQQQNKVNKSHDHLVKPTQTFSSSFNKSLPDLSFISYYSKELPQSSRTISSLLKTSLSSTNIARTTPSPILIHQYNKQDSDRPRTLKSIKRYKNSKHSTEPVDMFYNTQLITNISKPIETFSNLSREHHSENDLRISPYNPSNISNDHLFLLTKRYEEIHRCQTDIIHVDQNDNDSPPNEFCLQSNEKSHDNIILNLDEPVPIADQLYITMNSSTLDHLLEKINDVIKRLYEIKQADKIFILNNELNPQLDNLLKNDLCSAIQNILEHGRKDSKKVTLWKIIQLSISSSSSSIEIPQAYYEAKQIAQNISSYWLYKFQAFIFALLNKNELINWLYYFIRQKDLIQRYYQSPNALILVSISSTFNLFERIMTQLEKLTSLTFHLTYHLPLNNNEQSIISLNAKDWMMSLSRRTSKTNSNDTFRSTLSKKINAIFTKTNTSVQLTKPVNQLYSISKEQDLSIPNFQSKMSCPSSLNVDKPKSVRYRAMKLSSK